MIKIVPQQEAWVLENLGKFDRVLEPGLTIIIPIIQSIAYKHTLKNKQLMFMRRPLSHRITLPFQLTGVIRKNR